MSDLFSEIILTLGMSRTVEAFLKAAAHHRNFTVIVAETGPSYDLPPRFSLLRVTHVYYSDTLVTLWPLLSPLLPSPPSSSPIPPFTP